VIFFVVTELHHHAQSTYQDNFKNDADRETNAQPDGEHGKYKKYFGGFRQI
jgi:hypothetical protein